MQSSRYIPIDYGGRPVAIIGGGPSLTLGQVRQIGLARAQDKIRVIAINDAIYPCWFADQNHGSDKRWWDKNRGVPAYRGIKTSLEITGYHDVRTLKNTGLEGFDDTPGCIRGGCNSGYQAVHLAAQLGAHRIIIVGFDFSDDGAKSHWFGPHGPGMDLHSNTENWRRNFSGLTDELARRKIAVVNATIKSTITWLPKVNLDTEWS